MIELKNVNKIYRTESIETTAVNKVNLVIEKGDFVSLTGPSGAGKSSLLNLMGLLDTPSSGEIIINGINIHNFKDTNLSKLRNEHIGFIFQSYNLIEDLNIIENVELPLIYRKTSRKERKEKAKLAIEKVGLANRMYHFPKQLSGGQKQRVAIARAIVGEPSIILADEPTGNLDSKMSEDIMQILEKLNSVDKTTIVMVTHDLKMADRAKKNIVLLDGTIN